MADLDQNQTPADAGTSEATAQTPLDTILDTPAPDVPARAAQEAEADTIGGMDDPQVPLKALRRERERRQKADRQVEELRAEMERFENAKWGFDEPQVEERLAALDDPAKAPVQSNYDRSMERHKGEVAKIDAAIKRLSVEQYQHCAQLAGTHPDPVAGIRDYIDQLGLLDFKGQPIDQVLASRDKPHLQAKIDTSELARHVEQLNEYGQAVSAAELRTRAMASKADFVSEHGKPVFDALNQLATAFVESDPRGVEFRQIVESSPDPVGMAAHLLGGLGYWQPQAQRQQAPQQQMAFPSNLANRRNVGQRSGLGYGGPTPLSSIFRN